MIFPDYLIQKIQKQLQFQIDFTLEYIVSVCVLSRIILWQRVCSHLWQQYLGNNYHSFSISSRKYQVEFFMVMVSILLFGNPIYYLSFQYRSGFIPNFCIRQILPWYFFLEWNSIWLVSTRYSIKVLIYSEVGLEIRRKIYFLLYSRGIFALATQILYCLLCTQV